MSCAKCKECPPHEDDTWCLACTAWEALGHELCATWNQPAIRSIATEVVVGATRHIRALRSLARSINSAGDRSRAPSRVVERASGSRQASTVRELPPPPPAPKRAPSKEPFALAPGREYPKDNTPEVKEEDGSYSSSESVDSEELERAPRARSPVPRSSKRPAECLESPREPVKLEASARVKDIQRLQEQNRAFQPEKKHKNRHRGNRGGRRHPRLYRALEDPSVKLHKRPPSQFWDTHLPEQDGERAYKRWRNETHWRRYWV